MVCLEKEITLKQRTLETDLSVFILQSLDTISKVGVDSATQVIEMMREDICKKYSLPGSLFNSTLFYFTASQVFQNLSERKLKPLRYN